MRHLAVAAVVASAVALVGASGCGKSGDTPCSPQSEGFGDAVSITRTTLFEGERTKGTCRPRLEVLQTDDDLKRARDELDLGELNHVDFARERVVLRESGRERAIRWVVSRGDALTVGTEGCTGAFGDGCLIELIKITTTTANATATDYACPGLPCGSIPSEP